MDIPPDVRILAGIKRGSIYYFEEDELTSDEPHYFIVLNKNPKIEELLVLLVASSQVEKRKRIAKNLKFPEETMIVIKSEEYRYFSKETIFDCNRTFEKTPNSLIDKLKENKLKVCTEIMSKEIVKKLINGVIVSPQVSEEIKDILRK